MCLLPADRRDRGAVPDAGRRLRRRDRRSRGPRQGVAVPGRPRAHLALRHDILHVRRVLAPHATRPGPCSTIGSSSTATSRCSRATSSCTSPTRTTSCCAQPTGSTSPATCSRAYATSIRPQVANDQNEVMKRLTVDRVGAARADLHRRSLRPEPAGLARAQVVARLLVLLGAHHRDHHCPARVLPAQTLDLNPSAGRDATPVGAASILVTDGCAISAHPLRREGQ